MFLHINLGFLGFQRLRLCHFMISISYFIYVLKQVPSTSAVQENVATLLCCETPEMFCGL